MDEIAKLELHEKLDALAEGQREMKAMLAGIVQGIEMGAARADEWRAAQSGTHAIRHESDR